MTIKFPSVALPGGKEIERLRDLEFDKEFQRVKRFWASRSKGEALPVAFSKQKR